MKKASTFLSIILIPFCLSAQEAKEQESEFLNLLEEVTEIATKTKLNVDFVPGVVTVIKGSELQNLGVTNLSEQSLNMISSIESLRNIRGIGGLYSVGKIKFLINSKTISTSLTGVGGIPAISTAIIDRVEIIRGAGSAIYGENAYSGVINIVTKKEVSEAFADYTYFSSENSGQGAGVNAFIEYNNLKINLNLYRQSSDGIDTTITKDAMFYAGGKEIYEKMEYGNVDTFVDLELNYKDYIFAVNYLTHDSGEWDGKTGILPPNDGELNYDEDTLNIELKKSFNIGKIKFIPKVGYFSFDQDNENMHLYPKDFIDQAGNEYPDGWSVTPLFKEEKYYAGFDTFYKWKNHKFLLGGEFFNTELTKVVYKSNIDPLTNEDYHKMVSFRGEKNILRENIKREGKALYFQDEWSISEPLTLTLGVRYDRYSDVGNSVNPRIAGVYRVNDKNILKMQYAKAFRPPTFFQMYLQNNPVYHTADNMEPENIDTYEFSYIYNSYLDIFRVTLFDSKLKNLIAYNPLTTFTDNINEIESRGFEVEYIKYYNDFLKFNSNISFADTKDKMTNNELVGVSNLLGNIMLTFNLSQNLFFDKSLTLWYQYIGKKPRDEIDTRDDMKAQHLLNVSFSFKNLTDNLSIKFGVRDILGNTLSIPSNAFTYHNDIPYENRAIWSSLNYKF